MFLLSHLLHERGRNSVSHVHISFSTQFAAKSSNWTKLPKSLATRQDPHKTYMFSSEIVVKVQLLLVIKVGHFSYGRLSTLFMWVIQKNILFSKNI